MKDSFGRKIDYLRLSITNKCNLHCFYCRNGCEHKNKNVSQISLKEIKLLLKYLKKKGLKKVKITGGEPLLRKDLPEIIRLIRELGLGVSLTTNATLLAENVLTLYNLGLREINIGLDCLNRNLFEKITGHDRYEKVLQGINKALAVGFNSVKINVVLIKGVNEDIKSWLSLIKEKKVIVRFIELMPFVRGYVGVSNEETKKRISNIVIFEKDNYKGSGPAAYFKIKGFKGKLGFISPLSASFCSQCNRVRVSSRGELRGCLFSSETYSFLSLARNGFNEKKLEALIDKLLMSKPKNKDNLMPIESMCYIGG